MKKILFLCTGNSCRSQMAEGWAKKLWRNELEVYSAGIVAKGLDLKAVQVMAEQGVDIATYTSKTITALPITTFDLVITLCGDAHETCPVFFGSKVVHHGFDDPPQLAKLTEDDEEALNAYRRVCKEIASFVVEFPSSYPELFKEQSH